MSKQSPQLTWCIVRLGKDGNWWVDEVSDPIHWDTDALSIIDPRQITHIVELCEPLREYGFDLDLIDDAFFTFRVDKEVADGKIRLVRYRDSLLGNEEKLFALPDILNEDKGPYAEMLQEMTRARVKLLNDTLDLEHPLTVDEIEEMLTEHSNLEYGEGRASHVFAEITNILEYVPEGFEDEMDEAQARTATATDNIPEIEEAEDEKIEADETMRWGDEDKEDEDEDEEDDSYEDDEEEDDDDEPKAPRKSPKKPAPKPTKKSPKATVKKLKKK